MFDFIFSFAFKGFRRWYMCFLDVMEMSWDCSPAVVMYSRYVCIATIRDRFWNLSHSLSNLPDKRASSVAIELDALVHGPFHYWEF